MNLTLAGEEPEMRLLILSVIAMLTAIGCMPQTTPHPSTIAQRVTVVDGTDAARSVTNVVDEPTAIAALEALFPAYETRPKSDIAAGYIAQYVFIFDLRDQVRFGLSLMETGSCGQPGTVTCEWSET